VNLRGADLTKADFTGSTLRNVGLDRSTRLDAVGLTDVRLSSAFNVAPPNLARVLSEKGLFLEPRAQIAGALGAACRGKRVPGAGTSRSNGAFLMVFGNDGRSRLASVGWRNEPPALRFADAAVCVSPTETITIQTCGGYVLTNTNTPAAPITRYQERRRVRLVNARTGAVLAEQTFEGPYPNSCPSYAPESQTTEGEPLALGVVRRGIASIVAASSLR
jgi:hypothetical protein